MAVTVGTWNVQNLFRPGGEFGPDTQADYKDKLNGLADMITAADPDVLGLQEVGSTEALADLVDLLPGTWHTAASQHFDTAHPIRVAVLSRQPLNVVADVTDFPTTLAPLQANDSGELTTHTGRGILAVRVSLPGPDLTMVVCHLKSKLLTYPSAPGHSRFVPHDEDERARYAAYALYRRAAEAVTARALVNDLLDNQGQTRRLILVGDLNDEPQAATTQILYGPSGSQIGTAGADRPDQGDAWRLWNLAPLIPEEQRFTRIYQGHGELIDHILISHKLLDVVTDVRTLGAATLPSMTDNPDTPHPQPSDHSPVLATLAL